ncbi:PP2C family protein-serine/threonine phosphatase [Edaphobacillus lindanitolerans]|uniref:Sigma-B regulation protein RsbU (Phosphoserine phosphatase) n=1 Tax=Edaphobacillus lindanitolerans TaxID=550447 RepID=A0A1U7PSK0_9BACI|nr:PP2C family protein-serine/threonine phosphatase [Edaphobacillus lindanitolerans]SIT89652.1 sigma-B regulation protein RsbU (phosphoserine phosphatase) [Edaphobacillus lindanitolerans]
MPRDMEREYKEILRQYIENQSEQNLYLGETFSRGLIEKDISPEEVISIHKSALKDVLPGLPSKVWHSFDFLIEMMIRYGLALKEHQSLVKKQEEMQVEMELASNVQETLLKTKIPSIEGLDIGYVTVPSRTMSGDYIYFVSNEVDEAGVAVADVMGKGIPAALCMSMVKFGMDSLQHTEKGPSEVLSVINRIVEKSVNDSMFVTMFYGKYDAGNSLFSYASAGHEPALLYRAAEDRFHELFAKGLLLGVSEDAEYGEGAVTIEDGDFIAIMTDGVTEARTPEGFVEKETILDLIGSVKDKNAQEMAEHVFAELDRMQGFRLQDDFSLVILKKK